MSRRPRARLLVLATLALVALCTGVVGVTGAAWTDRASASGTATGGSWSTTSTCTVRDADGSVDATTPCTVLDGSVRVEVWPAGAGAMAGHAYASFSAPGIGADQRIAFDLLLPDPADPSWSWAGAGVAAVNNGGTVTSACSALPRVTGVLAPNLGETPGVYLTLDTPRSSSPVCRP
ncbi:hypothetical protein KIN34_02380 [Cellulomonas sp. DKR-3]|uniref:Secreted protein n=1 Tax=Cellulomonas fulva TaxID=2835530 RepID=A0ABS5TVF9_9CELL|nr:hypothetical protein [Cellulomonas fulva]MBT0993139.1 hypothetical protein [Cellulomonas fulva]